MTIRRTSKKLLAPSEWRIFSLLARRHPLSISEIHQELNRQARHTVAESTVRTLVKRLLSKGYLITNADDSPSSTLSYGPGVPFEAALRLHVINFLDQFALGGATDMRMIRDFVAEALLLDRITIEPSRTLIRGTDITVDTVLERLASGSSTEAILADHSGLSREDVQAAVAFARAALLASSSSESRY